MLLDIYTTRQPEKNVEYTPIDRGICLFLLKLHACFVFQFLFRYCQSPGCLTPPAKIPPQKDSHVHIHREAQICIYKRLKVYDSLDERAWTFIYTEKTEQV